jgi:hypothetical protein
MYPKRLIPRGFEPPQLHHPRFDLRPLTPRYLDADFAAIMTTGNRLDGTMAPPGRLGDVSQFTIENDITELHWHAREFSTRSSFAYIAVETGANSAADATGDGRSLGCAYVNPSEKAGFEAEVTCWGLWMEEEPDWDATFFEVIRDWVGTQWPFTQVVYPGRSMSWEQWRLLDPS